MLAREEQYRRRRARLVVAGALAFAVWQVADLFSIPRAGGRHNAWVLLSVISGLIWGVLVVRQLRLGRVIARDRALSASLQDELVVLNRNRSTVAGFLGVLLAQGAFLLSSALGASFSGDTAARLTIVVAVLVTGIAFSLQERD